jgi:hypothetical protein
MPFIVIFLGLMVLMAVMTVLGNSRRFRGQGGWFIAFMVVSFLAVVVFTLPLFPIFGER